VKKLLTVLARLLPWLQSFLVGKPSKSQAQVMDSADVMAVLRAAAVGAVIVFLTKIDSADWGVVDPLIGAVVAAAIEWFGAYKRDNSEGETAVAVKSAELTPEQAERMLKALNEEPQVADDLAAGPVLTREQIERSFGVRSEGNA
jgi:hypothetical protein